MPNGERYVTRRECDAAILELEGRITNCSTGTGIAIAGGAAALSFPRVRLAALALAVLVLAAGPAAAQSRGAHLTTGLSLASLGAYAAFADGDCSRHRFSVLQNGRCEWLDLAGRWNGVSPDRPQRQMAVGLAVAGLGGLMAGGVWEPSRTVDALVTAGAGFMLLVAARNEGYVPGTVHTFADDGRWFTECPHDMGGFGGTFGAVYVPSDTPGEYDGYPLDECRHTSFNRLNGMWTGVAVLGLAAGRWLWRGGLDVEVSPSAVAVSKTIEF